MQALADAPKPLYARVKDFVVAKIRSGEWPANRRIPSENELGPLLGVSRITVNRAFRELADEGHIRKVPGVGTFVSDALPRFGLASIAEEIRSRGKSWRAEVALLRREPAVPAIAELLGLAPGRPIDHSIVIHLGDDLPIQHEDRYVRPERAPGYLAQDYTKITTFDHLRRVAEVTEVEQSIAAAMPSEALRTALAMGRREPCLVIRRRTWCRDQPTTYAVLTQPAGRFEVSGRFPQHLVPTAPEPVLRPHRPRPAR
jgi:GntR family histidine utilization transcriptional repressor